MSIYNPESRVIDDMIHTVRHHGSAGTTYPDTTTIHGRTEDNDNVFYLPPIEHMQREKSTVVDPWERARRYEQGENHLFTDRTFIAEHMMVLYGFDNTTITTRSTPLPTDQLTAFRMRVVEILDAADIGGSAPHNGLRKANHKLHQLRTYLTESCHIPLSEDVYSSIQYQSSYDAIMYHLSSYVDKCEQLFGDKRQEHDDILWGNFFPKDRKRVRQWFRQLEINLRNNKRFATFFDQAINPDVNEGRGLYNMPTINLDDWNLDTETQEASAMIQEFIDTHRMYANRYHNNPRALGSLQLLLISTLGKVLLHEESKDGMFSHMQAFSIQDKLFLLGKKVSHLKDVLAVALDNPAYFWQLPSNYTLMMEYLGEKHIEPQKMKNFGLTISLNVFVDSVAAHSFIDNDPTGFIENFANITRTLLMNYREMLTRLSDSVKTAIQSGYIQSEAQAGLLKLLVTSDVVQSDSIYQFDQESVLYGFPSAIGIVEDALASLVRYSNEIPTVLSDTTS